MEVSTGQTIPPGWQSGIPWWTVSISLLLAVIALGLAIGALWEPNRALRSLAIGLAVIACLLELLIV